MERQVLHIYMWIFLRFLAYSTRNNYKWEVHASEKVKKILIPWNFKTHQYTVKHVNQFM